MPLPLRQPVVRRRPWIGSPPAAVAAAAPSPRPPSLRITGSDRLRAQEPRQWIQFSWLLRPPPAASPTMVPTADRLRPALPRAISIAGAAASFGPPRPLAQSPTRPPNGHRLRPAIDPRTPTTVMPITIRAPMTPTPTSRAPCRRTPTVAAAFPVQRGTVIRTRPPRSSAPVAPVASETAPYIRLLGAEPRALPLAGADLRLAALEGAEQRFLPTTGSR